MESLLRFATSLPEGAHRVAFVGHINRTWRSDTQIVGDILETFMDAWIEPIASVGGLWGFDVCVRDAAAELQVRTHPEQFTMDQPNTECFDDVVCVLVLHSRNPGHTLGEVSPLMEVLEELLEEREIPVFLVDAEGHITEMTDG